MRAQPTFKGIRRDISTGKPVARTGAHLSERPGVGALALCSNAVKQRHFREKYWNAVSLSIEKSAHIGGVWSEIRAGSLWSARQTHVSG